MRQYEYNCKLGPIRIIFEGTKRKLSEHHKAYAKRCRKLEVKVEPPMTEEEIFSIFIKTYDPPYFKKIFRMIECSFATIINKLEEFNEFFKAEKIVNLSTLKMQLETLQDQNNSGKKSQFEKNEGEAAFVWDQNPSTRPNFKIAPPTHLPTRTTQTLVLFIILLLTILVPEPTIQVYRHHIFKIFNQTCKLDPDLLITQDPFHQITKPIIIFKLMKSKININIKPSPIWVDLLSNYIYNLMLLARST